MGISVSGSINVGNVATGVIVNGSQKLDAAGVMRIEITTALNSPEIVAIKNPTANQFLFTFNFSGATVTFTSSAVADASTEKLIFITAVDPPSSAKKSLTSGRGLWWWYDDSSKGWRLVAGS
jgi:hypothetical protein